MNQPLTILVAKHGESPFWYARWNDPITGKEVFRSLKTKNRSEADQAAGALRYKIEGGYLVHDQITWREAVKLFKTSSSDYIALAPSSKVTFDATLSTVQDLLNPHLLRAFTTRVAMEFGHKLRTTPNPKGKNLRTEATVARHFRYLRILFAWFVQHGMIQKAPVFDMPPACEAKGRPLTNEEYQRMLATVPVVFPNENESSSLRHLIEGLWLSGLRIGEAMRLSWDNPNQFHVDLANFRAPLFVIPGHAQKNRKNQIAPMAPDFAEFLLQTPLEERTGFVFRTLTKEGGERIRSKGWATCEIADIGKAANIRVHEHGKEIQYATAHDLRRSFATRWAAVVEAPQLMQMMRHSQISTTMRFYALRNALQCSACVKEEWEKHLRDLPKRPNLRLFTA